MIEAFIDTLQAIPRGLVFVALGLIVLTLAKLTKDAVSRHYRMDEEVAIKGNLAVALRLSGYFMAVILVLLGSLYQPLTADAGAGGFGFDREFGIEVLRVFLYSVGGVIALNLVRVLFDRLILYKFRLEKEVVEDQNAGAGAAEFGMYIATGLLIAGSVAGDSGGSDGEAALVALAFFGMGLVMLVVFALYYEFTTHFNIHDEIEQGNVAVGVDMGSNLIAIGVVTLKAVFGDFVGWGESIAAFLTYGVLGFILLYAMRLLLDLEFLPTVRIAQALTGGHNLGVAFVDSAVVISSALILFIAI